MVISILNIARTALTSLLVASICACGSSSESSSSAAGDAPATTEKLSRTDRWFTDKQGRVVIIHGTNMINKLPPYTPEALGFGEEDLRFLEDNGFNGIRLGFSWAGVEPNPGEYDDAYIDHIVKLAAAAARHGLVPVVNFHQDGYSEVYGGNGAPEWASISYGIPGLTFLPPPANVLPGAGIAFENFWHNTNAPDGIGLQDHFAATWQHVAERFKNDTHTVFELYNEPSPGIVDTAPCALPVGCPEFDIGKLAPFYDKVLQAVRRVDPNRLVFVEPTALFALGARTWLPAINDPQIGFAFHNYCALGLVPLPLPATACDLVLRLPMANAQSHSDATGEPLLMNEFGAFDSDAVVAALLDQADQKMIGWMHWAYWGQDFGEPATYGLIDDLSKPPEGDNIKQGLLTVLSRPSPRTISGTPQSWSWDASTSTFQARYSTARADASGSFPAGAVSTFFVHPRFFPNGYQVQITGAKVTSPANASWLTLAALPGADEVVLSVTPAPND